MKRYCYILTGNNVWLEAAKYLSRNSIATPVFWLGDDRHFVEAKKVFGDAVHSRDLLIHYAYTLAKTGYNSENIDFFRSSNYYRAKERCMKMMDRLDQYGQFQRLDREIIFNVLCVYLLKTLKNAQPEALVMTESPHSHAQYLVYEICRFLDLPIASFEEWGGAAPLLFLKSNLAAEPVKKTINADDEITNKIRLRFRSAISEVASRTQDDNYAPDYQKTLEKHGNLIVKSAFQKFKSTLRYELFQIRKTIGGGYYTVNPWRLGVFQRKKIQSKRQRALKSAHVAAQDNVSFSTPFVYFALHFEPERTTLPDGGSFHDQFLALIELRRIVPSDINILVKEHPTQFFMPERGTRGRSALFYSSLKHVHGVSVVGMDTSTYKLITESELVATITGTAAREAAIMRKKALIFGDSWFSGCPGVQSWRPDISWSDITSLQTSGPDEIIAFLEKLLSDYSVIGCQNLSCEARYSDFLTPEFAMEEMRGVFNLLENFFSRLNSSKFDKA